MTLEAVAAGHRRPPDQVMWPVAPVPGESLMGFVARTAHENLLPSAYTILRRAGHVDCNRAYETLTGGIDVETLARALDVDPDEIHTRRLPRTTDEGFVSLHGVPVRQDDIITSVRRFAPATLAGDGLHHSLHMVKPLPFCATSWQYLQNACAECGRIQRWRMARDLRRCDGCGARLDRQPGIEVEEALRPALGFAAGLLSADVAVRRRSLAELPPSLSHLGAGDAFDLILSVMAMRSATSALRPRSAMLPEELAATAAGLSGAVDAVLDLHGSLTSLRDGIIAARTSTSVPSAHSRFARGLSGRLRRNSLPSATQVLKAFAAPMQAVPGGKRVLPSDCMSGLEASRILGRKQSVIVDARRRRVLVERIGSSNGVIGHSFDRPEILALGRTHRERIGLDAAAHGFGLPRYAMFDLRDHDLVDLDAHGWWLDQFGEPQTTKSAMDDLRGRIVAARSDPELVEQPVALANVMTGYGRRPKPWGLVLKELLDGDVPFTVADDIRTNRIMVPADAARWLRRHPPIAGQAEYSQRDALEVLNGHLRVANALGDVADDRRRGSAWSLDAQALAVLAGGCVTAAELAARTGLHAASVSKGLIRLNAPASRIGWCRAEAERKLGEHLGLPLATAPWLENDIPRPRPRAET